MLKFISQLFFVTMLTIFSTACSFVNSESVNTKPARLAAEYPQGVEALPLLREIWRYGAENIYPRHLAERFDEITLAR